MNLSRSCIVLLLGVCFLTCNANAQTLIPAVNLHISAQGVAIISELLNFVGQAYISQVVLPLPDILNEGLLEIKFNLTDLTLHDIAYSQLMLTINNNEGLQLTVGGITAHLNYTLSYAVTFPKSSGVYIGDAFINNTNIAMVIGVTESGGKPVIKIDSSDCQIGTVDLGLNGTLETITQAIEPLIATILDNMFESVIVPQINTQIANMTSALVMQQFIDPLNLTLIDMSLTNDPTFSSTSGIVIPLWANIHPTVGPTCPYSETGLQSAYNREVEAFMSETVPNCLMWSLVQSNLANILIKQLIDTKLNMNDRLGLTVGMIGGYSVISTQGLTLEASFQAAIDRYVLTPERWIVMGLNETITTLLSLNYTADQQLAIYPKFQATQSAISVSYTAPDMWADFQDQIANTNFTLLSYELTMLANTVILPMVNEKLAGGYVLPTQTAFLNDPELLFFNHYAFLGFDFAAGGEALSDAFAKVYDMHFSPEALDEFLYGQKSNTNTVEEDQQQLIN